MDVGDLVTRVGGGSQIVNAEALIAAIWCKYCQSCLGISLND